MVFRHIGELGARLEVLALGHGSLAVTQPVLLYSAFRKSTLNIVRWKRVFRLEMHIEK